MTSPPRRRSVQSILILGIGAQIAVFALAGLVAALQTGILRRATRELSGPIAAARTTAFEVEINAEELASATRAYLTDPDTASARLAAEARVDLDRFYRQMLALNRVRGAEELREPLLAFTATSRALIQYEDAQRGRLEQVRLGLATLDSLLDEHVQRDAEADLGRRPRLFQAAEEMEINLVELSEGLWSYLATDLPATRREIANDRADFERFQRQYAASPLTPAERAWSTQIDQLYRRHVTLVDEVLLLEDRKRAAGQRFNELERQLDRVLDLRLQPGVERERERVARGATRAAARALALGTGGLLIALLVGLILARSTLRALVRPLHALVKASDRLREGEFDRPVGELGTLEFDRLGQAFDRMAGELAQALRALGEARDAAEEASRRKSEFVSEVSHELRTPLTAIRAALGLLGAGGAGALPPAGSRLLELARRNSERLGTLIDDTLDLDRLEAGAEELRPEPLDAGGLVAAALDATRARAQQREVLLREEVAQGTRVLGEAARIERVLINLISNAIKYAPPGSTVAVRALERAEHARFEVEDAGPGIPADHQPRIFQRFARAGGANDPGGTGLGLTLARAMVEQHGGEIGFESRPGRTLFWFTIPAPLPE